MPISTSSNPTCNHFSWKIRVFPNQVEFEVKRSADGITFQTIAHVPIGPIDPTDGLIHGSYDDFNVADGIKYFYRVDTPYASNVISVVTASIVQNVQPDAPTDLKLIP